LRGNNEQELNVTIGKRESTSPFRGGFPVVPDSNFQMMIPFDWQRQTPPTSQIPQGNQIMPFPGENGETFVLPGNSSGRKLGVSIAPLTKQLGLFWNKQRQRIVNSKRR
jgi:hypothetical protein